MTTFETSKHIIKQTDNLVFIILSIFTAYKLIICMYRSVFKTDNYFQEVVDFWAVINNGDR